MDSMDLAMALLRNDQKGRGGASRMAQRPKAQHHCSLDSTAVSQPAVTRSSIGRRTIGFTWLIVLKQLLADVLRSVYTGRGEARKFSPVKICPQ